MSVVSIRSRETDKKVRVDDQIRTGDARLTGPPLYQTELRPPAEISPIRNDRAFSCF